jgi:hypothetical protein
MRWATTDITPAVHPGQTPPHCGAYRPCTPGSAARGRKPGREQILPREPSVEGAEETMRPLHGGGWDVPLCVRVKSEREREKECVRWVEWRPSHTSNSAVSYASPRVHIYTTMACLQRNGRIDNFSRAGDDLRFVSCDSTGEPRKSIDLFSSFQMRAKRPRLPNTPYISVGRSAPCYIVAVETQTTYITASYRKHTGSSMCSNLLVAVKSPVASDMPFTQTRL